MYEPDVVAGGIRSGCRIITVDSKPGRESFYGQFGFEDLSRYRPAAISSSLFCIAAIVSGLLEISMVSRRASSSFRRTIVSCIYFKVEFIDGDSRSHDW
jgi:hypothetical protein